MAEKSWDWVLLQLTVTMVLAALCLQALLPRWRKLAKHRRSGGISPLTNSPPLLAGAEMKEIMKESSSFQETVKARIAQDHCGRPGS